VAPIRLSLVVLVVILASCRAPREPARELEDRLYSPCCYQQSLRDHESPIANALRAEIESRIAAGEAADAIEQDLVRRFGEKIRALPTGADPRWMIALVGAIASLLGIILVARAVKRQTSSRASVTFARVTDEEMERLDDELALID
jgi:cytochrome c-type biogenesis protein CcmH